MKKNAVLLGYGTIGKGVEDLAKLVDDITLTNVFVLPEFVDLPYFTNDGSALVTNPDTDIVFECLSGTEPANTLIRQALQAGKHVISSNKAVIAQNLDDYIALADQHGGSLGLEASVAGGIPFLDALLKFGELEELQGYEGIFNGTSNYILDQMQKEDLSFDQALSQAQKLGYAEYDPTFDIEGIDAWYKAIIANALAFKSYNRDLPKPLGISRLTPDDVAFARKHHKILRHIVSSRQGERSISTIIAPAFLNPTDYLANIPLNYNAQLVFAPSFDQIGYFGQGAGRYPTAQAMLADAIDVTKDRIRPITLEEPKHLSSSMQKENWVVRPVDKKDLDKMLALAEQSKSEDGYGLLYEQGPEIIEKIQAIDPKALIAIWRD